MPAPVTFTAPGFSLASVSQLDGTKIRVRFSSPPRKVSAGGSTDALNPANYHVTGASAVTVLGAAPTPGDSRSIDLTTSGLQPGSYQVDVLNVVAG